MAEYPFKYTLPYAQTEGTVEADSKAAAKKVVLKDISKEDQKVIELEIGDPIENKESK